MVEGSQAGPKGQATMAGGEAARWNAAEIVGEVVGDVKARTGEGQGARALAREPQPLADADGALVRGWNVGAVTPVITDPQGEKLERSATRGASIRLNSWLPACVTAMVLPSGVQATAQD